jgi:hypothetical protein
MTVVSSKEFTTNQDKYFDMALDEQVYIEKGNNMFLLIYKNVDMDVNDAADDMNIYHDASVYEEVLEPDDDFRSAVSAKELLEMLHEDIHQMFTETK